MDATQPPASLGRFDLILCDVPCSGTGTLARNPEIRLRLAPEELARQSARQRLILAAALDRLAPGGRLVYSTCSLEPEECEQVVGSVAGASRTLPVESMLASLDVLDGLDGLDATAMTRAGALRTLPGVHPCDGFFAMVLERR